MTRKKNKCQNCDKDAVIIENKIYYRGPCAVDQFITRVHKRLRPEPCNNCNENYNKNG
jgi:hypothetical protein